MRRDGIDGVERVRGEGGGACLLWFGWIGIGIWKMEDGKMVEEG